MNLDDILYTQEVIEIFGKEIIKGQLYLAECSISGMRNYILYTGYNMIWYNIDMGINTIEPYNTEDANHWIWFQTVELTPVDNSQLFI